MVKKRSVSEGRKGRGRYDVGRSENISFSSSDSELIFLSRLLDLFPLYN